VWDGDVYRKMIVMQDGVVQTISKESVKKCHSLAKGDKKKKLRQRTKKKNREEFYIEKEADEKLLNKEEIK